jgi:hypothetical protein
MIEPGNDLFDAEHFADLHIWVMKLQRIGLTKNKALLWLSTPNNTFDNKVPFNMIKEGKSEELNNLILQHKEKAFE